MINWKIMITWKDIIDSTPKEILDYWQSLEKDVFKIKVYSFAGGGYVVISDKDFEPSTNVVYAKFAGQENYFIYGDSEKKKYSQQEYIKVLALKAFL